MNNKKPKSKMKCDFTSSDIYSYYKKTHTKCLTRKEYGLVCDLFNQKIIEKIYQGFIYYLPGGIGMIGINTSRVRIEFDESGEVDFTKSNMSTDWKATKELWKIKPELAHKRYILLDNYHTEGKRFKISWNRKHCSIPTSRHYRFIPSRSFRRNLAKYLKNNPNQQYYEF